MWFLYALLGAIGKSYSGFFRKKMAGNVSGSMYMWLSYAAILIVLYPILLMNLDEVIRMMQHSWLIVLGVSVTSISATILNMEALKREELSYTAPLNAFVPVFTLIIAGLFLQESLHILGIVGIIVIVIGAYVINISPGKLINWYIPLARLFKNTGARITLLVTLSFAINSIFIKVLTNESYNPLSILYVTTAITWLLLAYVPFVKRKEFRLIARSNKLVILGGTISSFAGTFFHILAVAGTYASYAVAVRRLEAPISVLLGWRHLKETNIRNKLIGSMFMVAGTVIIALF